MIEAERALLTQLCAEVWMSRVYRHGTTWELQYLGEGEAGNCTSFAYTVAYLLPQAFWPRLELVLEDLAKARHVELLFDGTLYVDPTRGLVGDAPRGTVWRTYTPQEWDGLRLTGIQQRKQQM